MCDSVTYLEEYQTVRYDVELPQWTVVGPQVFAIEEKALLEFGDFETFGHLRELSLTQHSFMD